MSIQIRLTKLIMTYKLRYIVILHLRTMTTKIEDAVPLRESVTYQELQWMPVYTADSTSTGSGFKGKEQSSKKPFTNHWTLSHFICPFGSHTIILFIFSP